MKKNGKPKVAMALVIAMLMMSLSTFAALNIASAEENNSVQSIKSTYVKPDFNDLTGAGNEPREISSAASAYSAEKEWYEYITYSSQPVGYYTISSNKRIAFYDPYDYSNAMIMEINDSLCSWSSADSITVSYETGNSISTGYSSTTTSDTSSEVASGNDVSVSSSVSTSNSTTVGITEEVALSEKVGLEGIVEVGMNFSIGASASWTDDESTENGKTTTTVAERITKSTGSSDSSDRSWSTSDSKTVSTTYNAAYFNSTGSPLQWKVVGYTVYMPMRCEVQYLINGEWVTSVDGYCLLTTIQGTCRTWIQNNTAFYEHWGTGEAVTWKDFWGTFFTKENLVAAYKSKLYPDEN